ncbi:MAG TPA: polysaccharide deacetylase family protein [Steroidobacteraceae bacterium]|nr:polysaccharide deacetylase family protein [Steroidobacteraceae bacterium]
MKTAFLKTCSRLGLSRIARGLTGHGVRILAYHGFCDGDEARFQPMLFMRAQTFRARMQRLLESGHRVISLAEAVRRLETRDIEPGLAVITIDDGWHGIHEHAWPVLRELDLPATVYVCSYYAQCQLPVLNVFARYLVWRSPLPVVALDGLAPGLAGQQALADRASRNLLADNLSGHADAMLAPSERLAFMRTVATRLEVDIEPVLARRTFHLMSPAQLGELAATGVALELHTHRHRFPPEDRAACGEEIERNRRFLADITGTTSTHFCYPSGEYGLHQKAWLRELGVRSATTTRHGLSYAGMDAMELPRFLDSDAHSPELFDAALAGLLAILREPAATLRRSLAD